MMYLPLLGLGSVLATSFAILSSTLGFLTLSYIIVRPIFYLMHEFISSKDMAKPLISIYVCDSPNAFDLFGGGIYGLIGIAMVVSMIFSILVYLVGMIFGNQKLITFVKTEFLNLLITFGVIVVGLGILYLPCYITVLSFTGSSGAKIEMNAYEAAFFFLQYAERYSFLSLSMSVIIGMLSLMVLKAFLSNNIFGGVALPVFSGLSLMIKPAISNTLVATTLSYVLYSLQVLLYEFLTYGAIKYLIPVGVLFRAFSPLKKIGGVIIGFALGATLIYTLVLDFSWYAAKPYMKYVSIEVSGEDARSYGVSFSFDFSGEKDYYEGVFGSVENYQKIEEIAEELNQNYGTDDGSGTIVVKDSKSWVKEFIDRTKSIASSIVKGVFRWVFVSCGTFTVLLLILPIVNVLIVITGVRFFSRFFGMDLDISNLTRVV